MKMVESKLQLILYITMLVYDPFRQGVSEFASQDHIFLVPVLLDYV